MVGFPRALNLVRDVERFAAHMHADVPHVREASSLIEAVQAASAMRVPRNVALQVPAFVKALKTYTHLIAALPLRQYQRGSVVTPRSFLVQPSQLTTYAGLMTRTVTDLLLYDVAYWRVVERSWDGFPAAVVHMPYPQLSWTDDADYYNQEIPVYGQLSWNGTPIPQGQVLRFDGDGLGGWLVTGAAAIQTAAALEAAALHSAQFPMPAVVLKNTGADLPATQVDDLLEAWETARTTRSTAYLNSTLETHAMQGWSPADLQLTDARNAAATQVARSCNLDPVWVGAGVPGATLTYQNRVDLMRQFLDLSAGPVMRMLSERLSMDDVTPRGHVVKFDTDALLKANTSELAQVITQLLPLEVMTVDEARGLLDLMDEGNA